MMEFMNLVSTVSPNLGSGMTSRLSALCRLDMSSFPLRKTTQLLGSFGSIFGAPLPAVADALGVEHAANDVIAYARKVLDAAAPDQHHRMLLQIMSLARDVAGHFHLIGKTDAGDLAQGGVGLLRRRGVDARTHSPFLRAGLHRRHFVPLDRLLARLADELLNRRHGRLFVQSRSWANAHIIRAPKCGAQPHRSSASTQRNLEGSSTQDHNPQSSSRM